MRLTTRNNERYGNEHQPDEVDVELGEIGGHSKVLVGAEDLIRKEG
jgi:hypothetical protein